MHTAFFLYFWRGIGEEAAGGGNKVGKMVGLVVLHSSSSLEDSELWSRSRWLKEVKTAQ